MRSVGYSFRATFDSMTSRVVARVFLVLGAIWRLFAEIDQFIQNYLFLTNVVQFSGGL